MAKRNKTPKTSKTAPKAPAKKAIKVVNADEMAAAVKSTTGNDYQQYIRNLFKDKLDRR
jgi:hypothetical protein